MKRTPAPQGPAPGQEVEEPTLWSAKRVEQELDRSHTSVVYYHKQGLLHGRHLQSSNWLWYEPVEVRMLRQLRQTVQGDALHDLMRTWYHEYLRGQGRLEELRQVELTEALRDESKRRRKLAKGTSLDAEDTRHERDATASSDPDPGPAFYAAAAAQRG